MAALPSAPPEENVSLHQIIAFLCMVVGMFMALLDIQVVSASLKEIQAGLSASSDEISWVQTAYLIAEVVMIPLSGLLSRALSTRWLFMGSAAGFTLASLACGLATTIDQMIICRALQGFLGGAMIPSVFAASYSLFPGKKKAMMAPLIGLIATLAPTIGPSVGGLLTEAFSWHWLFFINVVPGICVTLAAWKLIDFDQPNLALLKGFDWFALLGMAAFLCSLEYVLEEGPTNDWFNDTAIQFFTLLSVFGAVLFFGRCWWRSRPGVVSAGPPLVNFSAYTDANFSAGSIFAFILGIMLFGLTYLYPVFLGRVRGYNSLMIGNTMFVTGAVMFFAAPIAGRLTLKLDPRVMMAMGLAILALSTWLMTGLTAEWDFWEILWPQVLRGLGLMFCMIPVNNVALGTLSPARLKDASGLYNLTRNLGGAVGLACINTLLNYRQDLHLARLHEQVSYTNAAASQWLATNVGNNLVRTGDPTLSSTMALSQLAGLVRGQAYVMSLADVFVVLTVLMLGLLPLLFLLHKPRSGTGTPDAH